MSKAYTILKRDSTSEGLLLEVLADDAAGFEALKSDFHDGRQLSPGTTVEVAGEQKKYRLLNSGEWGAYDSSRGAPTDEQVTTAVNDWLDEHPEATTTVQDGSVTPNKTSFLLKKQINLYDPSAATVGRFDNATDTIYTTSGYISVKKTVYSFSTRPWYVQLYKGGVKVREFMPPNGSATMDLTAYTEDFDSLRMATYGSTVPTNMMFVEGELPREYVAYGSAENTVTTVTDEDVKKAFDNNAYQYLKEQGIPDDSFDFLEVHVCNLCDFSKAEQG